MVCCCYAGNHRMGKQEGSESVNTTNEEDKIGVSEVVELIGSHFEWYCEQRLIRSISLPLFPIPLE